MVVDGTLARMIALKNCGVVRNQNSKYQETNCSKKNKETMYTIDVFVPS